MNPSSNMNMIFSTSPNKWKYLIQCKINHRVIHIKPIVFFDRNHLQIVRDKKNLHICQMTLLVGNYPEYKCDVTAKVALENNL